jgi:hypothetical protein
MILTQREVLAAAPALLWRNHASEAAGARTDSVAFGRRRRRYDFHCAGAQSRSPRRPCSSIAATSRAFSASLQRSRRSTDACHLNAIHHRVANLVLATGSSAVPLGGVLYSRPILARNLHSAGNAARAAYQRRIELEPSARAILQGSPVNRDLNRFLDPVRS